MRVPPGARSRRLAFRAAGFMATSTFGASPGVRMSWSEMWTWKAETPAKRPGRAPGSRPGSPAGSTGRCRTRRSTSVNRSPVSCMPSPESPAKRMTTRSIRAQGRSRSASEVINVTSTADARRPYRELLFTAPGFAESISGVILYDETIRQWASDGTPFPGVAQQPGASCLGSSRPRRQGPGRLSRRVHHRGPRRPARAADHLPRARGPIRQVGADPDRPRPALLHLSRGQRPCSRALRGAVPGSRDWPIVEPEVDMEGDHTLDRCAEVTAITLLTHLRRVAHPARRSRGHHPQAQHGRPRFEVRDAGERRRSRRGDPPRPPRPRASGGAGDRVPLGRAERRGRDRPPRRHEPPRPQPLGAHVLLWPPSRPRP